MLSLEDLRNCHPKLITPCTSNIKLAELALQKLWEERQAERGLQVGADRSGSCKFAALLARTLFGGRLEGNEEHVFLRLQGVILDLNHNQQDVLALGDAAHIVSRRAIEHRDYREALGSCLPRVQRWADWVINHPEVISFRHPERYNSGDQLSL